MSFRDSMIIHVRGVLGLSILILGLLSYLVFIFLSEDQFSALTLLILLVLCLIALGLLSKILIGVFKDGAKC
jgi:hypothetical protein